MTEERRLEPITVSLKDAAARLGCSTADVRNLCASGRLKHVRIGKNTILIDPEWLPKIKPQQSKASPNIGSVVYFIEAPTAQLIKIGTSWYVPGRINTLSTSSPIPLQLLGCIAGTFKAERKLHERFAQLRSHGDWFHATDELLAFIKALLRRRGVVIDG